MAGVWVFKHGVAKLVQNPLVEPIDAAELLATRGAQLMQQQKVLVYVPTMQIIRSYADLEEKLVALGWRRYYKPCAADSGAATNSAHQNSCEKHLHEKSINISTGSDVVGEVIQFHRGGSSLLLISLPADFCNFKSMHMFDIVLKNRHHFEVRDLLIPHG